MASTAAATESVNDAAIFFSYTGAAATLGIASLLATRANRDTLGASVTPLFAAALLYENLAVGLGASHGASAMSGVLAVRGMVQAFEVPLALIALWELNYGVRKRRSANFACCLKFDQGHRAEHTFASTLARYGVWLLAVALLLLQLTCNAAYTASPASPPLTARFTHKSQPLEYSARASTYGSGGSTPFSWQHAADMLPLGCLCAFALFSGASLWRYGTFISTDVWASSVNPWASVTLAAAGLTAAWLSSPHTWRVPYAVNGMLVLLLAALVVTVVLVERNFRTLDRWQATLEAANESVVIQQARKATKQEMMALASALTAANTGKDRESRRSKRGNSVGRLSTTLAVLEAFRTGGGPTLHHGGPAGGSVARGTPRVPRGSLGLGGGATPPRSIASVPAGLPSPSPLLQPSAMPLPVGFPLTGPHAALHAPGAAAALTASLTSASSRRPSDASRRNRSGSSVAVASGAPSPAASSRQQLGPLSLKPQPSASAESAGAVSPSHVVVDGEDGDAAGIGSRSGASGSSVAEPAAASVTLAAGGPLLRALDARRAARRQAAAGAAGSSEGTGVGLPPRPPPAPGAFR